MLNIAVAGFGYWGPNIVRNFHLGAHSLVAAICDRDANALQRVNANYPDIRTTTNYQFIL